MRVDGAAVDWPLTLVQIRWPTRRPEPTRWVVMFLLLGIQVSLSMNNVVVILSLSFCVVSHRRELRPRLANRGGDGGRVNTKFPCWGS